MAKTKRLPPAPDNFRHLIDILGVEAVSNRLNLYKSHVHMMRYRNSVASRYWPILAEMAHELGYPGMTVNDCLRMSIERFAGK